MNISRPERSKKMEKIFASQKAKFISLSPITRLLLVVAIVIGALGFVIDLKNTLNTPGIDLRNRVVGARLLSAGLDPYYFKWTPSQSTVLLDPLDKPTSPISRTTVPPSTLSLLVPIASLPYKTARLLWFVFQWAALLLSLCIFARSSKSKEKALCIWVVGLIFVSGSYAWHSHIIVGQIYILYVLMLTLTYQQLLSPNRLGVVASGFLLGLTASMRFPVILIGIPIMIYRKWKHLAWSLIGLVFGLGSSILIAGVKIWKSYFTAMRVHGMISYSWRQLPKGNYPQLIEGVSWSKKVSHPSPIGDSSIFGMFEHYFGINISSILLPLLAIVALFCGVILYVYRKKKPSLSLMFQAGLVFVFVSEFFLPGPRLAYQDVIWLILLSSVVINCESLRELLKPLAVLALVGLCLSIGFTWLPGHGKIMEAAMVIYFTLTTLAFIRRSK